MHKKRSHTLSAILALLLAGLATTACAKPDRGDGEGRRGPPPEAIKACKGKSAKDACSFTGRHDDTVKGTCFVPPDVDELACAPEGGPPQRGGR